MLYRSFLVILVCLSLSPELPAQLSRDAKFEILRTVIADQAAARIAMPFGTDGIELSESGEINKEKLDKEMKKNGQSIEAGKVVTVTDIDFSDDKIQIELDGGGKNKKSFTDRIQIGIGSGTQTDADLNAVRKAFLVLAAPVELDLNFVVAEIDIGYRNDLPGLNGLAVLFHFLVQLFFINLSGF